MTNVCVLLNPAAGRGESARRLDEIKTAFARIGATELFETTSRGDEERLTVAAIDRGFRTIVVAGGDGTCARVADAILRSGKPCRLALIPTGTGNDFAKTLGLTGLSAGAIADLVGRGDTTTSIDVGLADGHYFINSCGFGFDPSVLAATQKVRFLKGDAVYMYSALGQLFSYRGTDVSVDGDAAAKPQRMLMVTVSNGRWLGGAFKIAPNASVLDGKLDACFFGDSNVLERALLFVGALRGTHLEMRGVSSAKVQNLSLTFPTPPSMEIDGELRTARSARVRIQCVPLALSVLAAPRAVR
jgi:YegS/Rv2252/BmrU family lipid kinase